VARANCDPVHGDGTCLGDDAGGVVVPPSAGAGDQDHQICVRGGGTERCTDQRRVVGDDVRDSGLATDLAGLGGEHQRNATASALAGLVTDAGGDPVHLTVAENVGFGPRAHGDHDPTRVAELLQRFGLTPLADRSPRSLSGGERQRAALARALAARPRLLLLDEPLSALDQPTRETLRGVLHDLLLGLDIPVVHVTHDRDEALTLAGDLAVIVGGRLRQLDAAQQVTTYPADPDVARLLGWTELGTGTVYNGHAVVGALRLVAPGHPDGSQTEICYRPEDVVLATAGHTDHSGRYTATVQQIVYTVPLARITLGPAPAITALVHRRDLYRLDLRMGETVEVLLPPTAIRLWPAANP